MQIGTVIASAICFVTAYLCREIPAAPAILSPILFISSILLAGWPVFAAAVKSLRHISLDEHLLVTIAVVAASFMGDFAEAAAVTLFFGVGELFEHYAVGRSRKSIAALSEIRPDTANLLLPDGATQQVSAQEVEVGATLTNFALSASRSMRGAFRRKHGGRLRHYWAKAPRKCRPESELLSGMINGPGTLTMRSLTPMHSPPLPGSLIW